MAGRMLRYEVKPEYQAVFRKAVGDYILYSMTLEGNVLSEAYYEQEDPSVVWVMERWLGKAGFEKAGISPQFKAIAALYDKALALPEKTIYINDLEPMRQEEWQKKPGMNDQPLTLMLFVDSRPGTESQFKEVYHKAMPQFRSEAGVIRYQLSQLEGDSTRFVTYEKFRNEEAFQYHLNFPPIQPVIDYLNTSIQKQPFQAGLHRLIEFSPLSRE